MTKHITVGFDGSTESTEALDWAAQEAGARGCDLRVVHCYRLPVASEIHAGWVPAEAYSDLAATASTALEKGRIRIIRQHPHLEVATVLFAGSPCTALSDPGDADQELVVLGASSRRHVAATWLGSTPRAIVRHSSCPVVVVRGCPNGRMPDRIVVGVDGSASAHQALLWAAAEADLHGAALHVVHAWEYPYRQKAAYQGHARDYTLIDAADLLHEEAAFARDASHAEVTKELVEAGAASGLLACVRDGDLLVLGFRGRGALRATMFGSTVNRVLDEAVVPVAVVRHPEPD